MYSMLLGDNPLPLNTHCPLSTSRSPCYSAWYALTGPTGLENIAWDTVSFFVKPPNNHQINALLHQTHHSLLCHLLHNPPHLSLPCCLQPIPPVAPSPPPQTVPVPSSTNSSMHPGTHVWPSCLPSSLSCTFHFSLA
jgi:hypothetical protein